MNLKLTDENTLQNILSELRKKSDAKQVYGQLQQYSDDWYDTGWGWNTNETPFLLPEIVCTPKGNYINDSNWVTNDYGDNYDYWSANDYGDNQGGGGGDYGNSYNYSTSESRILSLGQTALDHMICSIQDSTAIIFKEFQETKEFQLMNATSVTSTIPSLQWDLVQILKADQSIIKTLGTAMARGNAMLGGTVAAIGLLDGDRTTADWLAGASALFGTIGLVTTPFPWIGFTCDGISCVLSFLSTYYQLQEKQENNSY